jgi:hypothetical protein
VTGVLLTGEQIDALWKVNDPVDGEVKLKNAVAEHFTTGPGSLRGEIAAKVRNLELARYL